MFKVVFWFRVLGFRALGFLPFKELGILGFFLGLASCFGFKGGVE